MGAKAVQAVQTSVGEEVSTINDECRRVNPQFKGEFARFAVDRGRVRGQAEGRLWSI